MRRYIDGETHKKSKKLDGHRRQYDADNRDKRTPPRYTNFEGEPIE
jgi:hypothetical protein